ncbi:DSD1 family PLP-dependent enzyme [Enterobacter hormaechei]|uniref:DSD1 family PLP-dependent enzyme n=1 Tax=Enterobacter hormaechei TaxID=158836 RepID=UPI00188D2440|nr:DSD1 family PLP-dependent enzyme [Enterobacter hormaechei]MBF4154926.1 DSD1 family PLP-dependent enzyme [Enterobacter hormaechei]
MTSPDWLNDPETPYLLIDEACYRNNIHRLYSHVEGLGSRVRPHLKTLRSPEAAAYLLKNADSPATVSTLAEAEGFADAGYSNLLYAVGIAPHKLDRVARLIHRGIDLHLLLDTPEQARALTEYAALHNITFSVFIEVDCDGHRGGLPADSAALTELAAMVDGQGTVLTGLLAHAGESYNCRTHDAIRLAAKKECEAIRAAGERIRALGIACPVLSVGATPTAHFSQELDGISEVRAGVFTTFDLVMKNVGVCTISDIAMSVVTSVIGHNREKNWIFVDAGWMALSRDRGTASQVDDYGYGLVCDMNGVPFGKICVSMTNQEHGIISLPAGCGLTTDTFPVGSRLRILPNHACATAAMHQQYQVLTEDGKQATWHRITGW